MPLFFSAIIHVYCKQIYFRIWFISYHKKIVRSISIIICQLKVGNSCYCRGNNIDDLMQTLRYIVCYMLAYLGHFVLTQNNNIFTFLIGAPNEMKFVCNTVTKGSSFRGYPVQDVLLCSRRIIAVDCNVAVVHQWQIFRNQLRSGIHYIRSWSWVTSLTIRRYATDKLVYHWCLKSE